MWIFRAILTKFGVFLFGGWGPMAEASQHLNAFLKKREN